MHRYVLLSAFAAIVGVYSLSSRQAGADDARFTKAGGSNLVLASDSGLVEIIDDRPLTPEEAAAREPRALDHGANGYTASDGGCGSGCGSDCGGTCGGCGRRCGRGRNHCGLLCMLRGCRGAEMWSNCECNGSYKYPVPPLFTYFWPGLYSQQLMTDYHSPWRFPPIKPYEDEDPIELNGSAGAVSQGGLLHPVSHEADAWPAAGQALPRYRDIEPVSVKMRRRYGG